MGDLVQLMLKLPIIIGNAYYTDIKHDSIYMIIPTNTPSFQQIQINQIRKDLGYPKYEFKHMYKELQIRYIFDDYRLHDWEFEFIQRSLSESDNDHESIVSAIIQTKEETEAHRFSEFIIREHLLTYCHHISLDRITTQPMIKSIEGYCKTLGINTVWLTSAAIDTLDEEKGNTASTGSQMIGRITVYSLENYYRKGIK